MCTTLENSTPFQQEQFLSDFTKSLLKAVCLVLLKTFKHHQLEHPQMLNSMSHSQRTGWTNEVSRVLHRRERGGKLCLLLPPLTAPASPQVLLPGAAGWGGDQLALPHVLGMSLETQGSSHLWSSTACSSVRRVNRC